MAYGFGHTVPYPVRGSTLQRLHGMTPIQLQETPVRPKKLKLLNTSSPSVLRRAVVTPVDPQSLIPESSHHRRRCFRRKDYRL